MRPSGRYVIRERLDIRAGVVLQGAGVGRTILFYPRPLGRPKAGEKRDARQNYFISFSSFDSSRKLAAITVPAGRGVTAVTVDSAAKLAAGMWVRITMDNPAGSGMAGRALNGAAYASRSYNVGQEQLTK